MKLLVNVSMNSITDKSETQRREETTDSKLEVCHKVFIEIFS